MRNKTDSCHIQNNSKSLANMTDYRFVWLRDRISKVHGVQDHPDVLEKLINEHQEQFQAFMDDELQNLDQIEKCIFSIYRTFYDRLVEREVVTIEKGEQDSFLLYYAHQHQVNFHFHFSAQNHDTATS